MMTLAGATTPLKRGRPIEPSATSYAQSWLIEGATRLLFISGQTPMDADGSSPRGFEA
ncbi:hypothetical protein NDN01_11140 [Sphingomonas sp. QA11]|uniref:hypothetical protein n=1 Tax=Sphingomonas sp. QA11 TaxID=2950605 RepID=UPI00234AA145|nr:hypothetical protein [Sphingomonas sp. QA11]WCM29394.1 hypothetical protein NDN01_11140 [Sphingomonas sp. QA11]